MIRQISLAFALLVCSGVAHAQAPSESKPGPIDGDQLPRSTGALDHPKPNLRTAVDPVTSMPSLAFAPGIATPSIDVLAVSLVAAKEGASIRGTFAPFAFVDSLHTIIADTRVEIRGQSDSAKPWGMSLSTGYNSRTTKLREAFNDETLLRIRAKCKKSSNPKEFADFEKEVKKFADEVNKLLPEQDRVNIEKLVKKFVDEVNKLLPAQDRVNIEKLSVEAAAAKIAVAWNNLQDQERAAIADQAKKVSELRDRAIDAPTGECIYKDYSREKAKRAYSQGWSIRIEGNVDVFPYVEGPKIRADEAEPFEPPVKHGISGLGATGSFSWFPGRDSRLSLTASYSAKRAKPDVETPQRRMSLLLEAAINKGFGDIEPSGFQKGIAGGFQFGLQNCLEDGGCDDPVPYYDKSKSSRTLFVGAFLDLRPDEKLQLRIGAPLTIYSFASAPANTDGGSLALSFSPTVSLTTTKWVL